MYYGKWKDFTVQMDFKVFFFVLKTPILITIEKTASSSTVLMFSVRVQK